MIAIIASMVASLFRGTYDVKNILPDMSELTEVAKSTEAVEDASVLVFWCSLDIVSLEDETAAIDDKDKK